jgi:hypothetical protein
MAVTPSTTDVPHHDIDIHLAFRVASLQDFMTRLDRLQVKYRNFSDLRTATC